MKRVAHARNVDALGNRTTYTFDAAGQQVAVTNARGYTSTNVYDSDGRTSAVVNSAGIPHDVFVRRGG